MSESSCEDNLAQLGNLIVMINGEAKAKRMLATAKSQDKAVAELTGSYESEDSSELRRIVDAITGPGADDATRQSAFREGLSTINRHGGPKAIKTYVRKLEVAA